MSRDKQIEEMAKQLYGNFGLTMPTARNVATYLIEKKGYRKATDIFAEIEEMLNMQAIIVCQTRETARAADEPMLSFLAMLDGRIYSLRVVEEHIAELKKKYTESEKDNENA